MTDCPHCRMAQMTDTQRAVLMRIVAEGCINLQSWGSSCTELASWDDGFFPAAVSHACDDLAAKGLIADLGADYLFLYRPTVAGVHLAVAWLHAFLAHPPCEEVAHG